MQVLALTQLTCEAAQERYQKWSKKEGSARRTCCV